MAGLAVSDWNVYSPQPPRVVAAVPYPTTFGNLYSYLVAGIHIIDL